jgi:hypothetical protein
MPSIMSRSSEDRSDPGFPAMELEEGGGDAACWAHRVCPQCGLLNSAEHPLRCDGCGAIFPVLD